MNRFRLMATVGCVLLLALAGCTTPSGGPSAEPAGNATIAPGTTANLPLLLDGAVDGGDEVSLSVTEDAGLDVDVPDTLEANETGSLGGWVGFTASDDAEDGTHEVVVSLEADGETVRTLGFEITVSEPGETISQGVIATVNLTARTDEGAVAFTNREEIDASALPKAEGYQSPRSFEPLPLQVTPGGQLPGALTNALANTSINQSITVSVPDAFGPETIESEQDREETVERTVEQQRFTELPRQAAAQQGLVNESSEVGDRLTVPQSPLPYELSFMNETSVRIELAAEVGETYTLHDPWPDSAEVVEVTNETVELYVTPTVEQGEPFTWNPNWPDATEIVAMDNETITLRHSPEVGTTYTQTTRQGQQEVTVTEVGEGSITVSQDNPNPLGGETLLFEVTVLDERQPQPRSMPAPGGR